MLKMEMGNRIKMHRERIDLSQEELAEKLYVSRQTISKWENNRVTPDLNNTLMMSNIFNVSLDEFVKGEKIKMQVKEAKRTLSLLLSLWILMIIFSGLSVAFAFHNMDTHSWLWIIPSAFGLITLLIAFQIEKFKKEKDIKTYDEIIAYLEEKSTDAVVSNVHKETLPFVYYMVIFIISIIAGMIIF